MTTNRDDQYWADMADEMRRALHMQPLSAAEAAQEYLEASELPMSEEEIDEAVAIAMSGVSKPAKNEDWAEASSDFAEIDQEVGEVVGMCRNEGEMSLEVQEEMRRQKEEAKRKNKEAGDEDGAKS